MLSDSALGFWTGAGLPLAVHRTCPVLWHRQSRGFGSGTPCSRRLLSLSQISSPRFPGICLQSAVHLPSPGLGMQHTGVSGSPAVTSPGQTSQQQQFYLSGPQQLTHPGAEAAWPLTIPFHRAGTCPSLQSPAPGQSRLGFIQLYILGRLFFTIFQSQGCLLLSLLQDCPCVC